MKRMLSILMILALTMAMVACGAKVSDTKEAAQADTTEVTNSEENKTETNDKFPLTIVDSLDREITIQKKPTKVISMVPSMTETIFAIGKGDLLIGRTDFCDYPEAASQIQSIGSMTEGNIELLAELNPEIIFASTLLKSDSLKQIEDLGITVIVLASHDSVDGTYKMIEDTGLILDGESNAKTLVEKMKAQVEEVVSAVKGLERPSLYYVVSFGEYGDYTATGETFISQLIELAGGDNIAKEDTGWSYSLEKIIDRDPDYIVCSKYYDTRTGILNANGYKDLTAVKAGKLVEVDNNLLDRQGPRLGQGLKALAEILHPEAFK